MINRKPDYQTMLFPSALGWFGVIFKGNRIRQISFGYASPEGAWEHLDPRWRSPPRPQRTASRLVARFRAYARGKTEDFADLAIDLGGYTAFQCRVYRACRHIPYGSTRSYRQLAAQSGSPNAARAVGNCMAKNRIPLVIPCHRVVCFNGQIGSYSAPGGKHLKKRLLDLERR
ncbi:MAG: methylated-DNA--[protein]-cysteine S-methyltransferase [Pirellulales bacterium]|nr:methylated-DNA--[protein]-cysteine S-methyltransferase [Pirellulales bacterium]